MTDIKLKKVPVSAYTKRLYNAQWSMVDKGSYFYRLSFRLVRNRLLVLSLTLQNGPFCLSVV